jgi:hypothetical protein
MKGEDHVEGLRVVVVKWQPGAEADQSTGMLQQSTLHLVMVVGEDQKTLHNDHGPMTAQINRRPIGMTPANARGTAMQEASCHRSSDIGPCIQEDIHSYETIEKSSA